MSDILDRLREAIATDDFYLARSIVREADGSGDVNIAEAAAELYYEYLSSGEYGSRSWETMDALEITNGDTNVSPFLYMRSISCISAIPHRRP